MFSFIDRVEFSLITQSNLNKQKVEEFYMIVKSNNNVIKMCLI